MASSSGLILSSGPGFVKRPCGSSRIRFKGTILNFRDRRSAVMPAPEELRKGVYEKLNLHSRQHVTGYMLVISTSGLAAADSCGIGLPPEEKLRLRDDECEKDLENMVMMSTDFGLQFKDIKVGEGPSPPIGFQLTMVTTEFGLQYKDIKVGEALCPSIGFQIITQKHRANLRSRFPFPLTMYSSMNMKCAAKHDFRRCHCGISSTMGTINSDLGSIDNSITSFDDVTVSPSSTKDRELKIRVVISGARTQGIFNDVFSKLVAAAQPIPGFRRVKGGKTPDIPKDILLHILGPSEVNRKTIKKMINTTVAEYVGKNNLKVTKDLRVEQSYEELESKFQPGKDFDFDAILEFQDTMISRS